MSGLELRGSSVLVGVEEDFVLNVYAEGARRLWRTSETAKPSVTVRASGTDKAVRTVELARAGGRLVAPFEEGAYTGYVVSLSGFGDADILLELTLALDASQDELLVQVEQFGGEDTVVEVEHLYRFEKLTADGGYMVLPHGSGYLIPAECPDELPGEAPFGGMIGARWTMPLFGMVRGRDGLCVLVESWWDCEVVAEHMPGDRSALDVQWRGSLGKLVYPRRFLVRFARGMDYVDMAKLYREYARKQGLLRTLEEKAAETPMIRRYVENILFRWPAWNPEEAPAVLDDLRRLRDLGFGVNHFYPKWPSAGYSPERNTATTTDGRWQAFLHPNPVPGGWRSLVDYEHAVRELGCTVQGFIGPRNQSAEGPEFDEARWPRTADGKAIHDLSTHDALERLERVLDNLRRKGLSFDVLYFDGYSAHQGLVEDFSPAHPVTRRETFEAQNACFAETRRRGIMPGGELARFWCISDCDYFFFTDWASDRLVNTPVQGAPAPVGVPVPLFQLVFHDCYTAGFSGGGYALYTAGYDWWADRTPRLYELLFAAAPAHNWLPEGYVPVRDWEGEKGRARWAWLRLWNAYYRTVATSEMVSHEFLASGFDGQRIEFANGVTAAFDMAANRFRIRGIPDFGGDWESPYVLGDSS